MQSWVRKHGAVQSHQQAQEQLATLKRRFDAGSPWVEIDASEVPRDRREPFVPGLDESNYEFSVQEFAGQACVVLEFSNDEAPGVRFLHRFPPRDDTGALDDSDSAFMEGVECRWLTRSRARMGPEATLVWTDFSWGHPNDRLAWAMDLLGERRLAEAASWLRGPGAIGWDLEMADEIDALLAAGATVDADLHGLHLRFLEASRFRREEGTAMAMKFWQLGDLQDARFDDLPGCLDPAGDANA